MSYQVPTLNLSSNIWVPGNPTSNPPDIPDKGCQKYLNSRWQGFATLIVENHFTPLIALRYKAGWSGDFLGVPMVGALIAISDPSGITWFYKVVWWEAEHEGFANEYTEVLVVQCDATGTVPDPNR